MWLALAEQETFKVVCVLCAWFSQCVFGAHSLSPRCALGLEPRTISCFLLLKKQDIAVSCAYHVSFPFSFFLMSFNAAINFNVWFKVVIKSIFLFWIKASSGPKDHLITKLQVLLVPDRWHQKVDQINIWSPAFTHQRCLWSETGTGRDKG